jgi:hypothetical protein
MNMKYFIPFLIALLSWGPVNGQLRPEAIQQPLVKAQSGQFNRTEVSPQKLTGNNLLYGYRLSPSAIRGFVVFSADNPAEVSVLSPYADGTNNISAGELVNGDFFLATYNGGEGGSTTFPQNLIRVSTDTWEVVDTRPLVQHIADMAYDYTTRTLFGIVNSASTSSLVKIDIETGEETLVTRLDQQFIGIAVHTNGTMYAISITGNLYTVNLTTGAGTLIGSTELSPASGTGYFLQSIGFDHHTGKLYWAFVKEANLSDSRLYEVDITTGTATEKGLIGAGSEIVALGSLHYSSPNIPATPTGFSIIPQLGETFAATLSWTNPAVGRSGEALTALGSIVIERNGAVVHTIQNPSIGAAETWTDTNIPKEGDYIYTIYGITDGYTGVKAITPVFIGTDPCEVNVFPLKEGFEGAGVPICWKSLYSEEQNKPQPSTTTAHDGAQSWRFASFDIVNSNGSYLISPRLAVTDTQKSLKFYYNTLNHTMERFRVGYSTTASTLSSFIWVDYIEYVETNGWVEYSKLLPPETKFIAIEYLTPFQFYLYIDDITIDQLVEDVSIASIAAPHSGSNLSAAEEVKVVIKNNGSQAVSNIPVTYEIDGVVTGNEIVTTAIPSQGTLLHTFQTKVDLSALKSHTLKAYTGWNADIRHDNDTATIKVTNFGDCIFTLPFTEGFEEASELACWNIQYKAQNKPGIAQVARTGKQSWAFSSVNTSSDQLLFTPQLKLSAPNQRLSIRFYYNNQSVASATTELFQIGYSTTDLNIDNFRWQNGVNVPFTNGWQEFFALLPANIDVKYICIHYYSSNQGHLYIDDLTVREVNTVDVGITAITSPRTGNDLTDAEPVTIIVKNTGTSPALNVPVVFEVDGVVKASETVAQSLPALIEVTHTFAARADLSALKTHTIKAYTALTGDLGHDNDTLTLQVTNTGICKVSTFPYQQGFESPDDGCWSIYNLDGDFYTWERSIIAHEEGHAMNHGGGPNDENGWLVSPKIALPVNRVHALYFWTLSTFSTGDYGRNSVWISTTSANPADGNFIELWKPTSATPNLWEEIGLSLAPYAGQTVYIAFRYEGRLKHTWYLDDVEIHDITDIKDAGVTAILSPVLNDGDLTTQPVTVKVKNFGGQTLSNFAVKYKVDGQPEVQQIITEPLAALQEREHVFTTLANLSVIGEHTITAYTALDSDMNAANDTASTTVINYGPCAVTTFPYFEEFEREPDRFICWKGYDIDGTGYSWQPASILGGSKIPTIDGSQVAMHRDAPEAQDGWLVSPAIKIPANEVYQLYFGSYIAYPGFYGGNAKSSVWISTGSGLPESGDFKFKWEADRIEDNWAESKINLFDYADKTIYVAFRYQGTDAHTWFVDNVSIEQLVGADVGVSKILSPTGTDTGHSNVSVQVEITNFGATTLSSLPVAYKLNDQVVVTESYTGELKPGHTASYTFTQKIDLSAYGEYTLKAYTILAGDRDTGNDAVVSETLRHSQNVKLFGYRIRFDGATLTDRPGFVSFHSNTPAVVTTLADFNTDNDALVAGEYINGTIYAFSTDYNFLRLTKDWKETAKIPVNDRPSDMTYDYSTGTMYAIVGRYNVSDLNTVNLASGAMTLVGTTDRFIYTLAADINGKLYGLDYNGNLCAINKQTAAVTTIGQTGIFLISALQSMTFDHHTEKLFWAAATSSYEGRLFDINPKTAKANNLGPIGNNSQIVALYSTYPDPQAIRPVTGSEFALYPNPATDVAYLSGIPANAAVHILDWSGRTVYSDTAQGGIVTLRLNLPKGVYLVVVDNNDERRVQKLVIN